MKYYANGFTYKIEQGSDGWYSIYRLNEITGEYMPQLQAKDLEHAKSYCEFCEAITVQIQKIVD